MHTEGHDMGRDAADRSTPGNQFDAEHPGYETTDVNVGGIAVFLGGLAGFLVMFFVLCYFIGIWIDRRFEEMDGPANKWTIAAGAVPPGKGKNLESNFAMEQKQLGEMTPLTTCFGNLEQARTLKQGDAALSLYAAPKADS